MGVSPLGSLVDWIAQFGYLAVGGLMVIESFGIPIPSEVILPFGGYLAATGRLTLWGVVLTATVGSVLGALLLYWLSATGGYALIKRYGKYVLLDEQHLAKAQAWFDRRGGWAVFIVRLIPGIRGYISIPAGVVRMNLWRFCAYTALGTALWDLALAVGGMILGAHWQTLDVWIRAALPYVIGVVVVAAAAGAWWVWRQVRLARIAQSKEIRSSAAGERE